MNKQVIYLSYDGMTDSLGRSQVLPYLVGLARNGYQITIVSAEKPDAFAAGRAEVDKLTSGAGICWQPTTYTKHPPIISTLADIRRMRRIAIALYRQKKFGIVHCRSYITAFVGLALKRKFGCKFVFDMRGFYADERVDGNIWNTNRFIYRAVYRFFKRKERQFLSDSDAIISLTNAAKNEILNWKLPNVGSPKISVIPCCVDTELFDYHRFNQQQVDNIRKQAGIGATDFVLLYLGSVGTWYMLPDMMSFFKELLRVRPEAKFLFISRDDEQFIIGEAWRHGINANNIIVRPATRDNVPQLAMAANASIFFIKPVWSKKASSPTKLAELMALGIPCVANSGVGDVDDIIRQDPTGILVKSQTADDYRQAIAKMLTLPTSNKEAARQLACKLFALTGGIDSYKTIYDKLLN